MEIMKGIIVVNGCEVNLCPPRPPMNTKEIIEGINDAECELFLQAHLKIVGAQINAGHLIHCQDCWMQIVLLTQQRMEDFSQRVHH